MSLEIRIDGVPGERTNELLAALSKALRFEHSGSPALFSRVTLLPFKAGFQSPHALVEFLDPGPYHLLFEDSVAKQLEGLPTGPLMVTPGESMSLELTYREP